MGFDFGGFKMLSQFIFPLGINSFKYVLTLAVSAYIRDRLAMKVIRSEMPDEKNKHTNEKVDVRFSAYIGGKFWRRHCVKMMISSVVPSAWLCGVLVWIGYLFQDLEQGGFNPKMRK